FRIGRWELDRFAGDLEGLWVLEVELVAVDEPTPPVPEGVEILREMTDVNTFTSAALAALSPEAARTLVQTVYGRSE
ncbi:MAG: hypothetical protein OEZ65_12245, partial [Gemmatimonadota bacterium]|nr:hypothetical protein [Gemmatimonadota bacterium]